MFQYIRNWSNNSLLDNTVWPVADPQSLGHKEYSKKLEASAASFKEVMIKIHINLTQSLHLFFPSYL